MMKVEELQREILSLPEGEFVRLVRAYLGQG